MVGLTDVASRNKTVWYPLFHHFPFLLTISDVDAVLVAKSSPVVNNPVVVPQNNIQEQYPQHIQPPTQQPISAAPKAKRRKKETSETEAVPEWESQRPQWEQELGNSHARQQMKEIVQRPWATVNPNNPQMVTPLQQPIQQPIPNGVNSIVISAPDRPQALSWASVNQPSPVSAGTGYGNGDINGSNYRMTSDPGGRESTGEDGSIALIDKLPKNKQRQVYGLVSGLQGGIEHLQRELDSLKKALGIDD